MQHRPSRLVTTKAKNTLQAKRIDALLLTGCIPCRSQPNSQRGSRLLEDRAGSNGALMTAVAAYQATAAGAVGLITAIASRAYESGRPSQLFQARKARVLGPKPRQ